MQIPRHSRNSSSLAEYVADLQQSGRYSFDSSEARQVCGLSPAALKQAARRLVLQTRLASPRRGFFVIVPIEYRSMGSPPPSWYVDALMSFHRAPYYVGLLSAAALYGAAHQQPQEFQVVSSIVLRPAVAGRSRLRFFFKKHLSQTPTVQWKTETGSMVVSSPEATAVDMIRYPHAAGGLGNIITVLSELVSALDPERLVQSVAATSDLAAAQRLGYLLDQAGGADRTGPLAGWVARQRPKAVLLRPDQSMERAPRDIRWRLVVNETVEVDQ